MMRIDTSMFCSAHHCAATCRRCVGNVKERISEGVHSQVSKDWFIWIQNPKVPGSLTKTYAVDERLHEMRVLHVLSFDNERVFRKALEARQ